MKDKIQFLAYYLPQYHPIPENDEWWGKGFTEWTNVAKAKPLFKGHYQPILPADLGFYDLRVPEVQEEQSKLALEYGVDGFIYYQYWFGSNDKMLLEKPAEAMLKNKKIKVPFCFCWANETWKGIWHGLDNPNILIEQEYPSEAKGYEEYFNYLLPFFKDERYIKVDNMPMFHIYQLDSIPNLELFLKTFSDLAKKNGFNDVYFVATRHIGSENVLNNNKIKGVVGLDAFFKMRYSQRNIFFRIDSILGRLENKFYKKFNINSDDVTKRTKPIIVDYKKGVSELDITFPHKKYIPCVFPNWDNSPRSGNKSLIFKNSSPNSWCEHLRKAVKKLNKNKNNPPFIVIKSWNEWAEGNYLEPDSLYGNAWLESVREVKNG